MSNIVLRVNLGAPLRSRVFTDESFVERLTPAFVVEDKVFVDVYLHKADGTIDPLSTNATYTRKLALGPLGGPPLAQALTSSAITDGRRFELNTNTVAALSALGSASQIASWLELELTSSGGDIQTVFQADSLLLNQVQSSSTPAPTPANQYFTVDETLDRFAILIDPLATWPDFVDDKTYLHRGSGTSITVNSAKTLTVINAGTDGVVFSDPSVSNSLVIYPGQTVKFETVYVNPTTYTFTVAEEIGTPARLNTNNTFAQNQTFNGTGNAAPNQTAASAASIMTRQLVDERVYWPQRPTLRLAGTPTVANSGTSGWNNWGVPNSANWQLSNVTNPSAAAGWSRARYNGFLLRSGEAAATLAGRGFAFSAWGNFPNDTVGNLRTDIYFGNSGDTGGALTSRGLRLSVISGSPNPTLELGVHNGTSEQTASAVVTLANINGGLLLVWRPIGGIPAAGSKLTLWTRALGGEMVQRCEVVLATAFNSTLFAASDWTVIGSANATGPGYNVFRELGGVEFVLL